MKANDLLTNEEMSALLSDSDKADAVSGEREKRRRITLYNFRRPDRLSKEQVRSLYLLHDLFAHGLSSSLPLFLRAACDITLISVEQQSYGEYLRGLSDPNVLFSVSMQPLHGVIAIEVSPPIAFPLIDRMLGGTGESLKETRSATEIEQRILEGFLSLVTDSFREAWKPIVELEMHPVGCETRPQLLQIVAPNEVVVTVALYVQIGETKGTMSICLPVIVLEPIVEKFNQSFYSRTRETTPEQARDLLNSIEEVRLPVAAELVKARAAVKDLLSLVEGDVLRTNHRLDKPVYVNIGGELKFFGNIAASNNHIVLQVNEKVHNNYTQPEFDEEEVIEELQALAA